MNLPNQLTLLRIALSFLLIFLLLLPGFGPKAAALGVFVFAALTDLWDGQLARRRHLVSDFGKLLDPIADKVLVLSALVAFVQLQVVPAWMVLLIAAREFLITGLRLFALGKGQVLPAETAGKYKTVSQILAIGLTLLFLMLRETGMGSAPGAVWMSRAQAGIWWLMLLTAAFTVTSGGSFLWRNRKIFLSF